MREPYAEPWGERGTFRGVNTMKQARVHRRRQGAESARLARRDACRRRCGDRRSARRVRSRQRRAIDCGQALDDRARLHPAGGSVSADEGARPRHLRAGSPVSRRPEPGGVLGADARGVDDAGARVSRSRASSSPAAPIRRSCPIRRSGSSITSSRATRSAAACWARIRRSARQRGAAGRDDQQRLPDVRGDDQGIDRAGQARRSRRAAGGHPDLPGQAHRADAGRR